MPKRARNSSGEGEKGGYFAAQNPRRGCQVSVSSQAAGTGPCGNAEGRGQLRQQGEGQENEVEHAAVEGGGVSDAATGNQAAKKTKLGFDPLDDPSDENDSDFTDSSDSYDSEDDDSLFQGDHDPDEGFEDE